MLALRQSDWCNAYLRRNCLGIDLNQVQPSSQRGGDKPSCSLSLISRELVTRPNAFLNSIENVKGKDTCSNEDLKESAKAWDNFLLKFLCPSGNGFSRQIPSAVGENGWTIVYRRGTRTGSAYCWYLTAWFPQQVVYINLHLFICLIFFQEREKEYEESLVQNTERVVRFK